MNENLRPAPILTAKQPLATLQICRIQLWCIPIFSGTRVL